MADKPTVHLEKRVMFVFKDSFTGLPYEFKDDWFTSDEDGAASYPWLMNNTIAWVETRVVYEPEPWEPADIENLPEA